MDNKENDFDDTEVKDDETEEEPRVVDDPDELRQLVESAENDNRKQNDDEDVVYGAEVGNTCPICRAGIVEFRGGCNTCSNCQAQLKCGL